MSQAEGGGGTVEYIQHHLTNLHVGEWFMTWNIDSIVISVLLGILFVTVGARVAKNATDGVPGGFQNFVESILEFVAQLAFVCLENTRLLLSRFLSLKRHQELA